MMHHAIAAPPPLPPYAGLVTAAARCWRTARDEHEGVQRCLYELLGPIELGVLSPVFDSLLTLYETALGRRLRVGAADAPSSDERLLLGMLDGSTPRRMCMGCDAGAGSALDCALCSTRIMMALAGDDVLRNMVQ